MYLAERPSEDTRPSLGMQIGMNDKQELIILGVSGGSANAGLQVGDVPIMIFGTEVNMSTARETFGKIHSMSIGESVDIVVRRGDEEIEFSIPLTQRMDNHIFEEMEELTAEQTKLREAWSKNL